MPQRGGSLRPIVMTLASLSRPGYRFRLPSQQHLFLYESLNYSVSARRLASTSTEGRDSTKSSPDIVPPNKPGKSVDSKGSTLFSPAPSKPAPPPTSTSLPPTQANVDASGPESKPPVVADDKSLTKAKDGSKPEGRLAKAWAWVKHEANHYWDGSKLLAAEVRVSSKLLRKVLNGARLTRRERRQVGRNFFHHINNYIL